MVKEEIELELRHMAGAGKREVTIRGDERVDFGRVVQVMDWCKFSGMTAVTLDMRRAGQLPPSEP